jgi:hypothetical protein
MYLYIPTFITMKGEHLMNNNELFIKEIEAAFASVKYPGDDMIVTHPEYPETYEMLQAFVNKDWRDVTVELAEYWRMNTGRFTIEGFHYYLPGFLIADMHEDAVEIDAYLIFDFVPPDDATEHAQFRQRVDGFDEQQRAVISKFVNNFFDNNPLYDRRFGGKARLFWGISD